MEANAERAAYIVKAANLAPKLAEALKRIQEIYGERRPVAQYGSQLDDIWEETREVLLLWNQ